MHLFSLHLKAANFLILLLFTSTLFAEGSILEGFGDGSLGGIIKLYWSDETYDTELVKAEKSTRYLDKRIFSSPN